MSYDLQLYCCSEPTADLARLAGEDGFGRNGDSFLLQGNTWQVLFRDANIVEAEDIPANVFRELPGIKYLVQVNIEGTVPKAIHARVIRLAKKLMRVTRGMLANPQEDTIETVRGLKRIDFANVPKEEGILKLSWWFENDELFENSGYERFVEALECHMPEVLPRRYGYCEPPQFKLAEHGREHFVSFLKMNLRQSIVWYANLPFTYVYLRLPPKVGGSPRGYRCCQMRLEVQSRVLHLPGWSLALKRLWIAVAQVTSPFFAEIREGPSPVKAWWWSGIPPVLSLAAMIGPPYTELWPEFVAAGKSVSSKLFFIESMEERRPLSITPPTDIMQPQQDESTFRIRLQQDGTSVLEILETAQDTLPQRTLTGPDISDYLSKRGIPKYPKTWPFDGPFD
jgi:hypothetical protein